MRICIIGGTGHIGGMLVPLLRDAGHEISVVTRGKSSVPGGEVWKDVALLEGEYRRQDEEWHRFLREIHTDVMIDLLGVDFPAVYHELKDRAGHFVVCGSFWMYGPPQEVPTPEEMQNPCEFETYAIRYREILGIQNQADHDGVAFTAIMPSNICGPGKVPLEGRGGRDIEVHRAHRRGEPVLLPHGCNTLIAPCDVCDVASAFLMAVENRGNAAGEIYNIGPPYAITIGKFIETYATIYQTDIPVEYVGWERFFTEVLPEPGANYHFRAHMAPDTGKIREQLKFTPQYAPEESMQRAVEWMKAGALL